MTDYKKGRAPEQHRSTEPQEGRGDEGKTNGGSGAGWGAGGGLIVKLKEKGALRVLRAHAPSGLR